MSAVEKIETRLTADEAKLAESIASGLAVDISKTLDGIEKGMAAMYTLIVKAVNGRHLSMTKRIIRDLKAKLKQSGKAHGTVDVVCRHVVWHAENGLEYPKKASDARKAYEGREKQEREPRQPVADTEEAGTTMEQTLSVVPTSREAVVTSKLAELFGYLRELDQAGYDWSYAEQAIRSTYAEYSIEKSMQADGLDALDLEAEAA